MDYRCIASYKARTRTCVENTRVLDYWNGASNASKVEFVNFKEYAMIDVPGDGNCFFHSLLVNIMVEDKLRDGKFLSSFAGCRLSPSETSYKNSTVLRKDMTFYLWRLLHDPSFSGDGVLLGADLYDGCKPPTHPSNTFIKERMGLNEDAIGIRFPPSTPMDLVVCYREKDIVRHFLKSYITNLDYVTDGEIGMEELMQKSVPFLNILDHEWKIDECGNARDHNISRSRKMDDKIRRGAETALLCFEGLWKALKIFLKKMSMVGNFVDMPLMGPLAAAGLRWPFKYAIMHNARQFSDHIEEALLASKQKHSRGNNGRTFDWKSALIENSFLAWCTTHFLPINTDGRDDDGKKHELEFISMAFLMCNDHFDALIPVAKWKRLSSPDSLSSSSIPSGSIFSHKEEKEEKEKRTNDDVSKSEDDGHPSHPSILLAPKGSSVSVHSPEMVSQLKTIVAPSRMPAAGARGMDDAENLETDMESQPISAFTISDDDYSGDETMGEYEEKDGQPPAPSDSYTRSTEENEVARKRMNNLDFLPLYLREDKSILVVGYLRNVSSCVEVGGDVEKKKKKERSRWYFALDMHEIDILEKSKRKAAPFPSQAVDSTKTKSNATDNEDSFRIFLIRTSFDNAYGDASSSDSQVSNDGIDLSPYRMEVYDYNEEIDGSPLAVVGFKDYGSREDCLFIIPNDRKLLILEVCLPRKGKGSVEEDGVVANNKEEKLKMAKIVASFIKENENAMS